MELKPVRDLADQIREALPAAVLLEQVARPIDERAALAWRTPPARLGDYRILREVGRGGMGIVYEAEQIALGQNTHELVTRWLSALPLRERPRLVTTDGEFHSLRRQVNRLAEERLEIVTVPSRPVDALAERLAAALDSRTACVMVSSVLFETAAIVPGLERLAAKCRRDGIPLLLDAYHQLNVVPFSLGSSLEDVFVSLTGRHLRDDQTESAEPGRRRGRNRRGARPSPSNGESEVA